MAHKVVPGGPLAWKPLACANATIESLEYNEPVLNARQRRRGFTGVTLKTIQGSRRMSYDNKKKTHENLILHRA